METLADVLARDRRSDAPALYATGAGVQRYDYRRFLTTAWKAGNFMHHHGVRTGSTVAVVTEPRAQPVLAFLGASLLGAQTRFDPPASVDAKLLVGPTAALDDYDLPAGTQRIGYVDDPENPAYWYWEGGVWSENPTMPPEPCHPADGILWADERVYSHADLLAGARRAKEALSLTGEERVAVRTPLSDPRTVTAGVLAPLLVGAEILFPDEETAGDVAVAAGDAPEATVLSLDDVSL
ncbi:long-chain fatty acid--CoA ligase [Haloarchaeobius sp. HME9146]|uniref:long-chain fatty acid--CoA ligase n=1 Tax=Haloarchaeobius sp. HME9146 TaxID=2978732 RepID=UPI0021BF9A7C|nr:long-chain fatty acid--CoA ligase [Haloarchaeobius sp. HME9146]MCT9096007.1 long-chain fatty acid--CoA ligase [Haloarchaeobius sp. HME9146]